MKTSDNTSYRVDDVFDPRYYNVLKLATVKQCDLVLAEIAYSVSSIKRDLIAGRDGPGAPEWAAAARKAVDDYEHKGRMVSIRRDELTEIDKSAKSTKQSLEQAFFQAARELLDKQEFERIKMTAKARVSK